jgi:hypothetical protein
MKHAREYELMLPQNPRHAMTTRASLRRPKVSIVPPPMLSTERSHTNKSSWTGPFRLLDLPAELQLRVFELAVVEDQPVLAIALHLKCREFQCGHQKYRHRRGWGTLCYTFAGPPPLADTCRSVRHDVLNLYYKGNIFEIERLDWTPTIMNRTLTWIEGVSSSHSQSTSMVLMLPTTAYDIFSWYAGGSHEDKLRNRLRDSGLRLTEAGSKDGRPLWRICQI